MKVMTLCFIQENFRLLLGMKKRGFGAGRWNGFGGKVWENENLEQNATREAREEIGIKVKQIKKQGILTFEFENEPEILEVHIGKFLFKDIDTLIRWEIKEDVF